MDRNEADKLLLKLINQLEALTKTLNEILETNRNKPEVENSKPSPRVSDFEQSEELPVILTAKHIADYLQISRRRVYELFQIKPEAGGIPNFEIGSSKRVKKVDFIAWIAERVVKKEDKHV